MKQRCKVFTDPDMNNILEIQVTGGIATATTGCYEANRYQIRYGSKTLKIY